MRKSRLTNAHIRFVIWQSDSLDGDMILGSFDLAKLTSVTELTVDERANDVRPGNAARSCSPILSGNW